MLPIRNFDWNILIDWIGSSLKVFLQVDHCYFATFAGKLFCNSKLFNWIIRCDWFYYSITNVLCKKKKNCVLIGLFLRTSKMINLTLTSSNHSYVTSMSSTTQLFNIDYKSNNRKISDGCRLGEMPMSFCNIINYLFRIMAQLENNSRMCFEMIQAIITAIRKFYEIQFKILWPLRVTYLDDERE